MARLQEEQVNVSCHHTTSEDSGCCSKEMPGSTTCHPALGAEQEFTQDRAGSLQLKGLHHVAADSSRPLGFSQESPFLCLCAVLWDLRHKTAQGLRLKMQDNKTQGWASYKISWQNLCVFYTGIVSRQPKKMQQQPQLQVCFFTKRPILNMLGQKDKIRQ